MKSSLAIMVVGAALIASAGLARAQQMEGLETFPGHINGPMQDGYQDQPGSAENLSQRQPGVVQGRSASEPKRGGMTEQRSVTPLIGSPSDE